MTRFLDRLFLAGGVLAAFFLTMIAVLVLAQILGRLLGILVPSADDFARLSMSASSFLGLAYTLRRGGHIRVAMLLDHLSPGPRRTLELLCVAAGTGISGFFFISTLEMTIETYEFGEFTLGLVPVPKWIPQCGMVAGMALLFLAFAEDLVSVLRRLPPSYETASTDDRLVEG